MTKDGGERFLLLKPVILICVLKFVIFSDTTLSKPSKTVKAMMTTATPIEIPVIVIIEITERNRESFFDLRYFLVKNNGSDIFTLFL